MLLLVFFMNGVGTLENVLRGLIKGRGMLEGGSTLVFLFLAEALFSAGWFLSC